MHTIVEACPSDVGDVVDCLSELNFDYHVFFSPEVVLPWIKDRTVYLAVDGSPADGGKILAAMRLILESGSYRINAIASRRAAQRSGAGSALVQHAIHRCAEEGIPKLWCWSLDRYKTRAFYEKLGFTEAHRLERQFFGEDCWFFGKIVDKTN